MPLPLWVIALGLSAAGVVLKNKNKEYKEKREKETQNTDISSDLPDWPKFFERWFINNEEKVEEIPAPSKKREEKKWRIVTPLRLTLVLLSLSLMIALIPFTSFFDLRYWSHEYHQVYHFLKIVLFSATVGIGTNYIAIFLLFRPVNKILGLQGIIPKKRDQIIRSLARGIRENLLDPETLKKAIHDSNIVNKAFDRFIQSGIEKVDDEKFRRELGEITLKQARAFVSNPKHQKDILNKIAELSRTIPIEIIGQWVPDIALEWIEYRVNENREKILNYIDNELEKHIIRIFNDLHAFLHDAPEKYQSQREAIESFLTQKIAQYAENFDFEKIISDKLEHMDDKEFYELINDTTENELATLQYLGAVLGGVAGLVLYLTSPL